MLKLFFLFVAAASAVSAAYAEDMKRQDDLKDIFLRFYTGNEMEQFVDAHIFEARNLVTHMDLKKPTVIYIHGYTGSTRSRDVIAVVTAYLNRGDQNVIAMDWSTIAGQPYPNVVYSAQPVGKALAMAIRQMVGQGLALESVHVVGHSMGAQVAGYAGRNASFRLPRITGLDPAGPFFNFLEAHLTSSDAKFVDTIHTDAGFYGVNRASGAASFFPNNGQRVQPGCPTSYELSSPEDYCSHHRSWVYYAESLRNENAFIGTSCSSYNKFSNGDCDENIKVPMGIATSADTKGIFYLKTRSATPFGMQMAGALSSRHNTRNDLRH